MDFAKFLRAHFLTEYLRWLLLEKCICVRIISTLHCQTTCGMFVAKDRIHFKRIEVHFCDSLNLGREDFPRSDLYLELSGTSMMKFFCVNS